MSTEKFIVSLCDCQHISGMITCIACLSCFGAPCIVQSKIISSLYDESAVVPCCLACCCFGIGGAINRGKLRKYYIIEGSFAQDCCYHLFCCICAVGQEYQEHVKRSEARKNGPLQKALIRDNTTSAVAAPVCNTYLYAQSRTKEK